MSKLSKRNKAFSLLELVISIAVLAVGIVSILQAFSICARLTGLSADITRAIFLTQDKLEEIEFQERQGKTGLLEVRQGGEIDKFRWEYNLEADDELGLFKLDFKVSWQRANRQEELKVGTYLR